MASARAHGLLIGAGAAALALGLWWSGALDAAERMTWDARVRLLARPGPHTDRVVLVLLDQASLDWAERENGLGWPWPRQVYVPVVDFCARAGAAALAFDFVLTEPSTYGVEDDELLAQAIARQGRFVAPRYLAADPDSLEATRADEPIAEIAGAARCLGNVAGQPDPDGVFRSAALVKRFGGEPVLSLGAAAWRVGAHRDDDPRLVDGALVVGDRTVDLGPGGTVLLRFRGGPGAYRTYNAAAVIRSELQIEAGGTPDIDPSAFADAFVLFGYSALGLHDMRSTPTDAVAPGVFVHATVLDDLLGDDFMRPAPWTAGAAFTLVLALAVALAVTGAARVRRGVAAGGALLLAAPAAGLVAYGPGWWWPVMPGAIAAALALLGALVRNYATEGRQRRYLKGAFRQYLSPAVIERILVDPSALQLGGERRTLTIMFTDLAGFTSLSEGLDPVALTALLNDYLTDMTDIILAEGGTLDKYEGDAIIAFWNAPLDQSDHALRACRAAVACQRRLAARQDDFRARCGRELRMRAGLHTGDVVVGNMGSRQRFDYTVLGDAANLAARLEGANKAFGTATMISEATRAACGDALLVRPLGDVRVVGRREAVAVHELLGLAGDARPGWLDDWTAGLAACRDGRPEEALAAFARAGDDALAAHAAARLRDDPDFRGTWTLDSKG
ncbi:MAG TPA: adenylate/guanylate cyclase domain-containing protein [Candidatus Krumholzibacteria bacterium]|nr:adenylate/guanylate cyclase domain-containing protein [Candidatus Krumholzibacteria bacterium]